MIIATRIPALTERMRLATLRAAEHWSKAGHEQYLIDELERRGYRVTPLRRAA